MAIGYLAAARFFQKRNFDGKGLFQSLIKIGNGRHEWSDSAERETEKRNVRESQGGSQNTGE
jgi:hypothetical protein